ncbi:MAG: peptidoglycan-binding domain-containing protein [bacterium]|nr:peptidoglycan-binding domain-containing protein [bacterium]
MLKKLIGCATGLAFSAALLAPVAASAATLTQPQVSAIISLLQSFGADSSTIMNVQAALSGSPTVVATYATSTPAARPPTSVASCVLLSHALYWDITDLATQNQVTSLQQFLGVYPTTGRFGSTTLQAVKKWQSGHSIVSSGTASTTGYGIVGPRTRGAMAQGCLPGQRPNQMPGQMPGQMPAGATSTPTATIAVSGGTTLPGQPFVVSWKSTNAVSCNITDSAPSVGVSNGAWCAAGQGKCGTSGAQPTSSSVSGPHIYTITCTGPGGSATSQAAHTVGANSSQGSGGY